MPLPAGLESIPGAQDLHDWFGFWPDFHDAEIIRLHLNRSGSSSLAIHTWEMTQRVNSQGHYECDKHVVVEFSLNDLSDLALDGFNQQNVISSLSVEKIDDGFRLALGPCYGLCGNLRSAGYIDSS